MIGAICNNIILCNFKRQYVVYRVRLRDVFELRSSAQWYLEILRRAVYCVILIGGNRGCRAVVDMAVEIKIGK